MTFRKIILLGPIIISFYEFFPFGLAVLGLSLKAIKFKGFLRARQKANHTRLACFSLFRPPPSFGFSCLSFCANRKVCFFFFLGFLLSAQQWPFTSSKMDLNYSFCNL